MEKVCFALEIEDDWPPAATECVWCKRSGNHYIIENTPFFISGLACGDEFSATPDLVNGCIFEFQVVKQSGHSVVWAANTAKHDVRHLMAALKSLGCSIGELPQFSLLTIDVPPAIELAKFDALISEWEGYGLNFAFPTWRHGD
jgi:Domain of unknown function (DUF4265)